MDTHSIALLTIGIVEIVLALFILLKNPKKEINISYSLFMAFVALWAFCIAIFRTVDNLDTAYLWSQIDYVAASLIASSFLFFAWVFPYRTKQLKFINYLIVIAPTVIIAIILFTTDILTKELIVRDWGRDVILGDFYSIYSMYFIGYWIWGLINLFNKFKQSDGIHRWQLKWLLWGISFSSALGVTFNLFLPLFGNYQLVMWGPELSVVWLIFTSCVIFKKT